MLLQHHRMIGMLTLSLGMGASLAAEPPQRKSPVEPADSLAQFQIDPSQKMELIAHEPLVIDPVAVQFDDSGRLWVVEMRDYPTGPVGDQAPSGRVTILSDQNFDGMYDSATVFAEGLRFPTGLQLYRDGIFITVEGKLRWLRDTDQNGRVDWQEDWLEGFSESNSQLLANDPNIALDNRLYVANGLRTTTVRASQSTESSPSVDLGNRDLRINLQNRSMVGVTGPSQFGMSWDVLGHRYFCSNRNPCDAVLIEQSDIALSPMVGLVPMKVTVVPAGEESRVHPLTQAWTTSNLHAGQFSAACGLLVSSSQHLPRSAFAHALTCEPTGNLVHRRSIHWKQGRPVVDDEPPRTEWLASYDPWFRPVNLYEGPDGAIYVVDMYRAVIEHPAWVPDELKHRLDERYGDDRGRIYRVSQQGNGWDREMFRTLARSPLSTRTSEELVNLLQHSNEWFRSTAARLLMERSYSDTANLLRAQLRSDATPVQLFASKLRMAYALESQAQLDNDLLQHLLSKSQPQQRAAVWRLVAGRDQPTQDLISLALKEFESHEREVVIACCWAMAHQTFSEIERSAWIQRCSDYLAQNPSDGYALTAIAASCREHLDELLYAWSQTMLERLGSQENVEVFWQAVVKLAQAASEQDGMAWPRLAQQLQQHVADSNNHQATPIERWWLAIATGWSRTKARNGIADASGLWNWARQIAASPSSLAECRVEAMELLSVAPSDQAVAWLSSIASIETDAVVRGKAIAAWAKHRDPSMAAWLLDTFQRASPRERVSLFPLMLQEPTRLSVLLEALETKQILIKNLDASQRQALQTVRDLKPKERIEKLLASAMDADRAKVIEDYQVCFDLQPHLQAGKNVFRKHCTSCHRLEGDGYAVGPDISDSRTRTAQQLLVSILDPNRAVDNNYFRFVVLTKDGQIHDGIVVEETSQSISLRSQNAKLTILQRDEIDELKPAGVSLMPEGVETQISPQDMADLIHYIKYWRYDSAGIPAAPATSTKVNQK